MRLEPTRWGVLGVLVVGCAPGPERTEPRTGLGSAAGDERAERTRAATEARVYADPAHFHLGKQPWGTDVPFRFLLINETADSVRIRQMQADCDCTILTTRYEGMDVRAGESVPVDVVLKTGETPGLKKRAIDVALESGEKVHVEIVVDVLATYELSKGAVDFGSVDLLAPQRSEETVLFSSADGIVLQAARPDRDWVSAAIADTDPPAVNIRLIPDRLAPGEQAANVVVVTSETRRPYANIRVYAKGHAPLRSFPREAFLRPNGQATVTFFDDQDKRVALVGARCDTPSVECSILPNGALTVRSTSPLDAPAKVMVEDAQGRTGVLLVRSTQR